MVRHLFGIQRYGPQKSFEGVLVERVCLTLVGRKTGQLSGHDLPLDMPNVTLVLHGLEEL